MVLAEVSLNGYISRYPHELSGGEKQRLAIARAIAPRPRYLLMDEPFSNLDPILKDELQKMVQRLREDHHLGIIYVTHIMEEVLVLADRIAVMNEGQFVQVDYKERLLREPKNEFVRRMMCMSLVAR